MPELYRPRWKMGRGPIPQLVVRPTIRFMRTEAAGGFVIVAAAIVALIWANVASDAYHDFWSTEIVLDLGVLRLAEPLAAWVNDALMVVFFFVVTLEIKREAVRGELSDRRQAALPVAAAIGGMALPAVIFTALNAGGEGARGWGIPVATDIAFALGVLSLLGRRVPLPLKMFLLTLAIADDIGGILIIALFYTDALSLAWLGGALGVVAVLLLMRESGVRPVLAYLVVGLVLWLCVFESGVHATIAGVVLGLLTPAAALYDRPRLSRGIHLALRLFDETGEEPDPQRREREVHESLRRTEHLSRESLSPLERLEEAFTPWSAFVVLPIFALANAGISLSGDALSAAVESRVAWGVAVGLVAGKFVGIVSFSFLAVWLGLAVRPAALRWSQIGGAALLGGVGFTVAIFIAGLSYDEAQLVEDAKIGILAASVVAAMLGYLVLRLTTRPVVRIPAADEEA